MDGTRSVRCRWLAQREVRETRFTVATRRTEFPGLAGTGTGQQRSGEAWHIQARASQEAARRAQGGPKRRSNLTDEGSQGVSSERAPSSPPSLHDPGPPPVHSLTPLPLLPRPPPLFLLAACLPVPRVYLATAVAQGSGAAADAAAAPSSAAGSTKRFTSPCGKALTKKCRGLADFLIVFPLFNWET
eukprot:6905670-Pyramimonas_sp.AAC.1